jgi:hypothetical protein
MDTVINSWYVEWTVNISRDGKQLIFSTIKPTGSSYGYYDLYVSEWDVKNNRWKTRNNLGKNINFGNMCLPYDAIGSSANYGGTMPDNGKKFYFSKWMGESKNRNAFNYELMVSCKDSNGNWERAKRLNINTKADTANQDSFGWST